MSRYFLEFCFKGTNYSGWQKQRNAASVQQILDGALQTILNKETVTTGCCRTDAGVHAAQMFAHFDSEKKISAFKFIHQLNGIMPPDISILNLFPVDKSAHARFDATLRTYRYFAFRKKNPFLKDYAAAFYFDLNIEMINRACKALMEYDDFKSFAKNKTDVKDTICKIKEAKWEFEKELHCFTISSNRFLRGMVRAIAGTLIKVGKEEINISQFRKIIEGKSRSDAGASVPAHGLYLWGVDYKFITTKIPVNLFGKDCD